MPSILYDYSVEELQYLLDTSNGYSDVLRKIGLNPKGGNPKTLKRLIKKYNLDVSKMNNNRSELYRKLAKEMHTKTDTKLEDILNGNCKYKSSNLLKRLVDNEMKEYKCERCGISEWMGEKISLQLHHKDGNHSNNKFENLEILCPNCHSQTDTFAGKSSRRKKEKIKICIDKPQIHNEEIKIVKQNTIKKKVIKQKSKEPKPRKPIPIERKDLKFKIRTQSFLSIGKEFGLSDNMIRKWCKRYNLPFRKRDIDSYTDEEWTNV